MERITIRRSGGHYETEDLAAAVEQLGRFETMVEELLSEQEALSAELAQLRDQGQTKTYHFREKMARKLNNNAVIDRLEQAGLL